MAYRANAGNRDKQQEEIETANADSGVPVQTGDAKTRNVQRQRGGAARTANTGTTLRNNAGVVMPHDDAPGRMVEETQGKA